MPKYSLFFNTLRDWYIFYYNKLRILRPLHFPSASDSIPQRRRSAFTSNRQRTSKPFLIFSLQKRLNHPWPFNYYINFSIINKSFFRKLKQGVLQFVLIKPFTAILSLVLMHYGYFVEGSFSLRNSYIYISIVNNISVSVHLF